MAEFKEIKNVLLDIEGTVCPISFVKDTLFPYALTALPSVLESQWSSPSFAPYREAFPPEHSSSPAALQAHVKDLTRRDVKVAYLKNLQGYLWEDGYKSGAYATPLFADVIPALRKWHDDGKQLTIYSSGSVFAQKLLFEHVKETAKDGAGEGGKGTSDYRGLFSGWFDTVNAGLKMERGSYERIAAEKGWKASETLFLSDNVKETEAAREAGMQVCVLEREGNAPLTEEDRATYPVVQALNQIMLAI